MNLSGLETRVRRLEDLEASRPVHPVLVLILRDLRELQRIFANGVELIRRKGESGEELVERARRSVQPSKRFVSLITSENSQ